MGEHLSVEEALSREVIRKLQLATEAETKDDREIICEELFCDITGTPDVHAQERLGLSVSTDPLTRSCTAAATSRSAPPASATTSSSTNPSTREKQQQQQDNLMSATGDGNTRTSESPCPTFYEVLARFYQRYRDSGEVVAHLCQRLWGQGYAAPIFALLMHRWLLLGRGAELASASSANSPGSTSSGVDGEASHQRPSPGIAGWRGIGYTQQLLLSPLSKHSSPHASAHALAPPPPPQRQQQPQRIQQVSVLVLGARQLFLGDVHTGLKRFAPLYNCLVHEVVLGEGMSMLSRLPLSTRSDLLATVAAVLPYYASPSQMHRLIASLPPPTSTVQQQQQQLQQQRPEQQQEQQQPSVGWDCVPGAGADFLLGEVSETLGKIRSEAGLLQYLAALQALKGSPHLRTLHPITSLRLQSELYSLTSPGGPHYAPRPVRVAAMRTLDAIYPMGRRTRRIVGMLFRLLHPTDWLGEFWLAPIHWWAWLYTRVLVATFCFLYSVVWRRRQQTREAMKPYR